MNKEQLINSISKVSGLSKVDSAKALKAFLAVVTNSLANHTGVRLVGFGSFQVSHRNARKGRNPQTGAPLTISARNVPKFKAGQSLKKAVNK